MELTNRTALVTGAGQGIGRAVAETFAKAGAKVIAVDLTTESMESLDAKLVAFDLARIDKLESLVDAVAKHGEIDVLVNCAGICPTRPLLECDQATWMKVFDVNVHAPFFLSQMLGRKMIPRGSGSIINLASVSSFLGKAEQADYGASKAAVVSITRSLATVFGPHGIRVNAIAPGVIDTPLTQQIAQQRADIRGVTPKKTLEPVLNATPLRRIGSTMEVAELALFLASERSSFITGQTIVADGGFLMR